MNKRSDIKSGNYPRIFAFGITGLSRVPTGTGKMGRHFPVREKSGNFDQTGKVRENQTKYWKTEGISDKYYMLFFSDCQINLYIIG